MAPDSCPDRETLAALAAGRLSGEALAAAAAHLDACPACLALAQAVGRDTDPLVAALCRPGPADPHAREAGCDRAVARLRALADAGEAIDAPTVLGPGAAPLPPPWGAGQALPVVPGHEVLGELSRGGMGVVYRARQLALNRTVALKMILQGGQAGDAALARFKRESEAIARLSHPNIVQVYEVGEQDGQPFFSLEYVDGGSLDKALNGTPLPPGEAAALVEALARAMYCAHGRGIVHRDLKPGNVLLAFSREPPASASACALAGGSRLNDCVPKITDFGLAKRLGEQGQTQTGSVVGTPSYMAPEQAEGKKDIGPAADVYGLGAILYECLTGRPPFRAATPLDTVLQVITEEPVPPGRLQPKLPPDLETICLKCLEKDPTRRYASAAELADDLQRFQTGQPVRARPTGPCERLVKWAKRRPTVAGLILASTLAVLAAVGLVTGTVYNSRLRVEKERAESAQRRAEMYQYFHHTARAHAGWREGDLTRMEALLDACPPEQRRWEWRYLKRLCQADLFTLTSRSAFVYAVAFSPDGRLLAWSGKGPIALCDAATGQTIRTLPGPPGFIRSVAFSPDGKWLASAREDDHRVTIWDVATGQPVRTLKGHTSQIRQAVFSPDGARLAAASYDRTVRVWDARTGEPLKCLKHPDRVFGVAFSPDGARLASTCQDRAVRVWDVAAGRFVHRFEVQGVWLRFVQFSPDGTRLAAGVGHTVKVWDAATGLPVLTLQGHTGDVWCVAFSPDGARLASAGVDQTVKVWDVATGQRTHTLRGHRSEVLHVAFSPDGARLATGGLDGTVKVWDPALDAEATTLRGHAGEVWSAAFHPDGSRLASAGADGTVKVWDTATGQVIRTLARRPGLRGMAFSPDWRRVATAGRDGVVQVCDAASGRQLFAIQAHTREVGAVSFSPDGQLLASAGADGTVRVWDAQGKPIRTLDGTSTVGGPFPSPVAFSPDGARLACADSDIPVRTHFDSPVRLHDALTGREDLRLKGHSTFIWAVAFRADGKQLASASGDNTAKVWDAVTGEELRTLEGHSSDVRAVAFSPDGSRLATASRDGTIKLWDVETGQEALTLRGHVQAVVSVAFSPDGDRLLSASWDGTVKVWDARPLTAEVRVEREAVGLLARLFAKPLSRADVIKQLRTCPISPSARRKALDLAQRYREETDPERFRRGP